jgi:hypothetical protein
MLPESPPNDGVFREKSHANGVGFDEGHLGHPLTHDRESLEDYPMRQPQEIAYGCFVNVHTPNEEIDCLKADAVTGLARRQRSPYWSMAGRRVLLSLRVGFAQPFN